MKKESVVYFYTSYFYFYKKIHKIFNLCIIASFFLLPEFAFGSSSSDSTEETEEYSLRTSQRLPDEESKVLATLMEKRREKQSLGVSAVNCIEEKPGYLYAPAISLESWGIQPIDLPTVPPFKLPSSKSNSLHEIKFKTQGDNIEFHSLSHIHTKYKIPKSELKALKKKKLSSHASGWKNCYRGGAEAVNIYTIHPSAVSFRGKMYEKDLIHDYYDISLNLAIQTPQSLLRNHFLPKEFIISVQPIYYNGEGWELIEESEAFEVWQHSPEADVRQNELTMIKGYTCTATGNIGVGGNVITGGPTATGSVGVAASYTSTFSTKRVRDDIVIKPMDLTSKVEWKITFNNLHSSESSGFCPADARTIKDIRWIWRINHKEAKRKLYSANDFDRKKNIFYFKIDLFARYALVDPQEKKTTNNFLPVFNNKNGDISQVIGLISSSKEVYTITKGVKTLGNYQIEKQ